MTNALSLSPAYARPLWVRMTRAKECDPFASSRFLTFLSLDVSRTCNLTTRAFIQCTYTISPRNMIQNDCPPTLLTLPVLLFCVQTGKAGGDRRWYDNEISANFTTYRVWDGGHEGVLGYCRQV